MEQENRNIVWEYRNNWNRFYTSYDPEKTYEEDEHHLIVAKDVSDEMAQKLVQETAKANFDAFLNTLPPALRTESNGKFISDMIKGESDERKMEMPNKIPDKIPAIVGAVFVKDSVFVTSLSKEAVDTYITLPASDIEPDTITFHTNNGKTEVLKFCQNGDIFVHGRLAENDKEVVQGLRDFLKEVPKLWT